MVVYFSGCDSLQSFMIVYSRLKFEQPCSMHHEWCIILFLLLFSSTKQVINQKPVRITDPTLVLSHQNKNSELGEKET
jgi:hypothetical protein